jgi:anaerobic selenocysteine-containing dehydrogenase
MWERVLRRKAIELHAALTPVWSETAQYADYVLPMGVGAERHDLMSQETHAAQWIGFRQPVLRAAKERVGEKVDWTWQANPGEVWEEDEFWISLSWRVDPDGSLGIRKWFESPYRKGVQIGVDELPLDLRARCACPKRRSAQARAADTCGATARSS